MSTRCILQALRWSVWSSTCSVFNRLQHGRNAVRFLAASSCRRSLPTHSSNEEAPLPATEMKNDQHTLLDMGFTVTQVEDIYHSMSNVKRNVAAKHFLPTLTFLFGLGFNPTSVAKILLKCPELYTTKETLLQQRISNLRKLGFVEGSLQRVVAFYPVILSVPVKTVKQVVVFLREKCLFTLQQVTDILKVSPAVVLEDLNALEIKFQYVYFRMGIKQSEMIKAKLFRFSLEEIRCRHCFLERRGFYQTPDKKGQTLIINPKLDNILCVNLDTFLKRVAKATEEEYDVFRRLMAREWQEEDLPLGVIEADDESGDDDEEDEEEHLGKAGYIKGKKK
ncbi:transcription termination factor 4, mitochondrial [Synchiropus splendidus]|uniref:transcription termination factor 4, mitochondrial n=1 Tax=Synchiropus splendidus TaxID=270530 RepID=UPI00237E45EE|nr:transcription termination factor 4, mitochondrial [Synchiropus splendidus]